MSEQVQCMSAKEWAERAPTRRMVLEDDYDTLHAEAEALRVALLRAWGVPDPGGTSFLGVGLLGLWLAMRRRAAA